MLLRLVTGFAFAFAMIAGQASPCQPAGTMGGCPNATSTLAPTKSVAPSPFYNVTRNVTSFPPSISPYPSFMGYNQTNGSPFKSPDPTPLPSKDPIPSSSSNPSPTPVQSRNPAPSSDPSPTPVQSRNPAPSSDPSPTPVPSRNPAPSSDPSPTPVPSRNPAPSSDPSRTPLASRSPNPASDYSQTSVPTPLPSRSPVPSKNSKPSQVPAPGAVQFTGANVTRVQDPNYLGQVQGLLGCTYNVPFNNINITNMTHTDATGTHVLNVPAIPFVNYTCGTTNPRRLRELQTTNSVTINYIVLVDPTYNLSDIATLLQSSPYVTSMVSTLGATGLSVPETNSVLGAAPGSTINGGSSSSSLYAEVFGPVGALLALSIFAIAGVWVYSIRQRNANMVKVPSQSKVVKLVVENSSPVTTENVLADRRQFDPVNVRSTIHV
uniref:Uncharacterized protein n=1 Tax=viral metagenome TaxID=1070528 RepID=A0A6C0ANT9_9ZZZZ